MRPPDQIPNLSRTGEYREGDTVYFWNGHNYSRWFIKSLHDFESAVTIKNGIGPMIVKPTKLISKQTYLNEKLINDTNEACERYKDIVHHWERGLRKSKEIGSLIGQSARATGQMIAAAKRWGLIKEPDDTKSGDANSGAGSAIPEQRP
jgi:hypothetical protein